MDDWQNTDPWYMFPQSQGYQPRLGLLLLQFKEYLGFSHFGENKKMMTYRVLKTGKNCDKKFITNGTV
jgi:hypothetical protein